MKHLLTIMITLSFGPLVQAAQSSQKVQKAPVIKVNTSLEHLKKDLPEYMKITKLEDGSVIIQMDEAVQKKKEL